MDPFIARAPVGLLVTLAFPYPLQWSQSMVALLQATDHVLYSQGGMCWLSGLWVGVRVYWLSMRPFIHPSPIHSFIRLFVPPLIRRSTGPSSIRRPLFTAPLFLRVSGIMLDLCVSERYCVLLTGLTSIWDSFFLDHWMRSRTYRRQLAFFWIPVSL